MWKINTCTNILQSENVLLNYSNNYNTWSDILSYIANAWWAKWTNQIIPIPIVFFVWSFSFYEFVPNIFLLLVQWPPYFLNINDVFHGYRNFLNIMSNVVVHESTHILNTSLEDLNLQIFDTSSQCIAIVFKWCFMCLWFKLHSNKLLMMFKSNVLKQQLRLLKSLKNGFLRTMWWMF